MKKTLLVFALAAILIFAFASTALAKNAGSNAATGDGYVSWNTAASIASGQAAEAAGPHDNYTVSTVKCAVCHSVHGAPSDTWLLTKVTNSQVTAGANAGTVCSYCHGYGATAGAMIVAINATGNSPHSSICYTNCHAGVHGVGVSSYSALASKLLTNKADTLVAQAITDSATTGLSAADFAAPTGGYGFDNSGAPTQAGLAAATYPKTAMATAYLCGQYGCHVQSAFGVKVRGGQMEGRARGASSDLTLSGHPVVADDAAAFAFPAGSSHTSATAGADPVIGTNIQVAFKPTAGCPTCHDLADAGTTLGFAFPHNKGASNIWLTKAADSNGTNSSMVQNSDVVDSTTGTVIGLADNYTTVQDGICLKCHRSGNGVSGVGQTF